LRVIFLSIIILVADQVTKLYVKGINIPSLGINFQGMRYGESIEIINNLFNITFIENPGMAFGIELGGKLARSIFTLIAAGLITYYIYKNRKESVYLRLSLAFILGGALGNLIDRVFYGVIFGYAPLFYGRVVDFMHFNIPDFTIFGKNIYTWPIFNVADIAVTIGFVLIIFGYKYIFKNKKEEVRTETSSDGLIAAEQTENTVSDVNIGNNESILQADPPDFKK
jgi:signal peptidase II